MNKLSKALLGTAAAAVAVTSFTPAIAREYNNRHDNEISVGDVIAGAIIIGGIAAVADAIGGNDRDRRDRDYGYDRDDNYRYGRNDDHRRAAPRRAVEQCVRAAENEAMRYGYRNADVTDVRSINETRYGYEITGRIAVENRNWRGNDRRYGDDYRNDGRRGNYGYSDYGRGWDNDYRGWDRSRHRGFDSGRFRCRVDGYEVRDVRLSGISR